MIQLQKKETKTYTMPQRLQQQQIQRQPPKRPTSRVHQQQYSTPAAIPRYHAPGPSPSPSPKGLGWLESRESHGPSKL